MRLGRALDVAEPVQDRLPLLAGRQPVAARQQRVQRGDHLHVLGEEPPVFQQIGQALDVPRFAVRQLAQDRDLDRRQAAVQIIHLPAAV